MDIRMPRNIIAVQLVPLVTFHITNWQKFYTYTRWHTKKREHTNTAILWLIANLRLCIYGLYGAIQMLLLLLLSLLINRFICISLSLPHVVKKTIKDCQSGMFYSDQPVTGAQLTFNSNV